MGQNRNIALIGMPGCGKSSLGRALAEKLERKFVDVDELVVELAGRSIPEIFAQQGEAAFRELESRVVEQLGGRTGLVIATGGGTVKNPKNVQALRRQGVILFIHCPVELLQLGEGRPLAKSLEDLRKLEAERLELYRSCADAVVEYHPDFMQNLGRVLLAWEAQALKVLQN